MTARALVCLSLAMLAAGCALGPSLNPSAVDGSKDLSRQLLVTIRQSRDVSMVPLGDPAAAYTRRPAYGPSPSVDRKLDQIARAYRIRRLTGWHIGSIGEYCEVYELAPGQDLAEVMNGLLMHPDVQLVQAMNVFETEASAYNDPYISMQPAIGKLGIDAAHEVATGKGVTVAVVDSRVDLRHPELRGKIRSAEDFVAGRSWAVAEVHGTAIAGIIGASANNGVGIVGVAPDSTIAPMRACWTVDPGSGRARCSSFSLALAIETAIELDVDVINLSLSGPSDSLLESLLDAALARGIVVVAAAPQTPGTGNEFPSSHAGVIVAGAADLTLPDGAPALLLAPGSEVMSTVPNQSYAFFSGNSMAAAFVSGVSALVLERRPATPPDEIARVLADSSRGQTVNACLALADGSEAGFCPDSGGQAQLGLRGSSE